MSKSKCEIRKDEQLNVLNVIVLYRTQNNVSLQQSTVTRSRSTAKTLQDIPLTPRQQRG